MLMMREKQDLRLLRELAQHAEARGRPLVIEINKQVVGNEWHGFGVVEVVLEPCALLLVSQGVIEIRRGTRKARVRKFLNALDARTY